MSILEELKRTYILKGVGVPEYYLVGQEDVELLDQHWKDDGVGLALSAKTYIKNVIPKFETLFGKSFKSVMTPMVEDYNPEMDESRLLSEVDTIKFRSVIGSNNWTITLGHFDVNYATSALSRFNMAPREGHLKAAKRILVYLKTFPKGRIIFDVSYPDHGIKYPVEEDHPNWKEFTQIQKKKSHSEFQMQKVHQSGSLFMWMLTMRMLWLPEDQLLESYFC